MAENADGSIVIDTELDNEGFKKGSEKLLNAVKDLTNAVDNLGDNMMNSFGKITPLLSSIAASAASVNAKIADTATQAAQSNEQIVDTEQRVTQAVQQATQAVQQQANSESQTAAAVQQTTQAVQQQTSGIVDLADQANTTTTSMSALEKEITSVSNSMESISSSAETGLANGKAVIAFDAKLRDMEDKIASARQRLEEFGNTKIPTEDYIWIQNAIQKTETQLDRLIDRQSKMKALGVKESSKSWKQLSYDIEYTEQMLQTYRQDLAALEYSGKDHVMGADTQQYAQMEQQLEQTTETLNRNRAIIDQEALAQARLNVQVAQERVLQAENAAQRQRALTDLQAAQTEYTNLANSMATANSQQAPSGTTTNAWAVLGTVLQRVGAAAVRTTTALARMSFNAIANGVRAATNRLRGFARQATQTNAIAKKLTKTLTGLKRMLISRVKRMFISAIFNNIKEGIQALAKFSSEFDNAMSNIRNRGKELGYNFSVVLGSLIQSLEPLITNVLQSISDAITYFNAFIAMLGGKTSVTVAKKQTDSYAKSLDNASASAKELKRQVYSFDELNKKSANKDSDSDSSGNIFEEVPIESILPDSIQSIFEKLKEDIQNKDWPAVGLTIATGINDAVKAIDDWINNVLRPKGVEWAKNIAEILNGLTAGIDWGNIGKTISDGLNAVFDIAHTFLSTYNFEDLGHGIGKAIAKMFSPEGIDWELIGKTFAAGANAIIDLLWGIVQEIPDMEIGEAMASFIKGLTGDNGIKLKTAAQTIATGLNKVSTNINAFLKNTPWKELGQQLGDAIQLMFSQINFDIIGENIGLGINAIISWFTGLNEKIEFDTLGADLASGVNKMFNTVNWDEMGALLSTGFNDAVLALSNFIGEAEWGTIGESIGKFLTSVFVGDENGEGGLDIAALGELFSNCLKGVLNFGTGLLTETDFTAVVDSIFDGLSGAFENFDFEGTGGSLMTFLGTLGAKVIELFYAIIIGDLKSNSDTITKVCRDLGWDSVADFFQGITDKLSEFSGWLKRVVDAIIADVQAFWSGKPSAALAQLGEETINSILQGITDAWEDIKTFFSDAIQGVFDTFDQGWKDITKGVTETWEAIKKVITDIWDAISGGILDGVDEFATDWGIDWDGITKGITDTWDNISKTVSDTWNTLSKGVSDGLDIFSKDWSFDWKDITKTVTDKWNEIKSNAGPTWENIRVTVYRKFDSLRNSLITTAQNIFTTIGQKWENIKTGATTAWNNITTTVSGLWNGLKNILNGSEFVSVGTNLVDGLKRGISDAWNGLTQWVTDMANGLTSSVQNIFGIHSPSKVWAEIGEYLDAGLAKGLKNEEKAVINTVSGIAEDTNKTLAKNTATLDIDMEGDRTLTQLDIISDRLSSIAETFRVIGDFIARASDISIPVMASGTEAPYKTRIAADTPSTVVSMSDDLDETLEDQTYVLKQMLAIMQRFKVKLSDADIQALAKAIYGHSRQYGGA